MRIQYSFVRRLCGGRGRMVAIIENEMHCMEPAMLLLVYDGERSHL